MLSGAFNIMKETFKVNPKKIMIPIFMAIIYCAFFNILLSFLVQIAIDTALTTEVEFENLILIGILLLFSCIFYIFIYRWQIIESKKLTLRLRSKTLKDIVDTQLDLNLRDQEKITFGTFSTIVNEDLDNYSNSINFVIIPLVKQFLTITAGLIYGFIYSPILTITVILFVVFYQITNSYLARKVRDKKIISKNKKEVVKHYFNDVNHNIPLLRVWKLLEETKGTFNFKYESYFENEEKVAWFQSIINLFSKHLIAALEFFIFLFGLYLAKQGHITIGTVVGLWNGLVGSILWSVVEIPYIYEDLSTALASEDRIKRFINKGKKEIKDQTQASEKMEPETDLKLIAKDISFSYSKEEILKDINLEIDSKNKIYFLRGESGSGKTTLAKLLLGLYKPNSGEIYISTSAGKDYNLLNYCSYVPQTPELMPLSVKDNICLGLEIETEELEKIIEKVNLKEKINSLKNGIYEIITEDNVSVGEAQRINIARAILNNKRFIILDEPFSAIDQKNKKALVELIKNTKDISFLIISHELNLGLEGELLEI